MSGEGLKACPTCRAAHAMLDHYAAPTHDNCGAPMVLADRIEAKIYADEMPDLSALIERLEKASGELDIDTLGQVICAGYGVEFRRATRGMGDDGSEELSVYAKDQQFEVWGDYRSRAPDVSIDAAVAFAERVLPGCWYQIAKGKLRDAEPLYGALIMFGSDEVLGAGEHPTSLPIAILIATLRAMEQGGKDGR